MKKYFLQLSFVTLACLTLANCAGVPKDALKFTPETIAERQLQTRRFDTNSEKKILTASAQLLQDMGFSIEESETKLGVITASKNASAVNPGQVAAAILVSALSGVSQPFDREQKIRVSAVTHPSGSKTTKLRITFQRLVWNTNGQLSRVELVDDPEIYKEFFEKLSKSVFLTAHQI